MFKSFGSELIKLIVNNKTIRANLDLTTKQDIVEMSSYFKFGNISSHRAIRFSGVYAIVFDTEPCDEMYKNELRGMRVGPSNEIDVVFNTVCRNTVFNHYCFSVQNRVFYMKNGQFYYSKV